MGLDAEYGALVGARGIGALLAALITTATAADAACRQALSLGLDVSGSVDLVEYELQLRGVAGALRDADVQQAFLSAPDAPVRLHVFEWAGMNTQRVVIDWIEIDSAATLAAVADRLDSQPVLRTSDAGTALGAAIVYGAEALATQGDCWVHTLDISSDGMSNTGPRPDEVAGHPALAGITVNGLVIGNVGPRRSVNRQRELLALARYFRDQVIRGPGAFVEIAQNYAAYQETMARKLLRELETLAIGAVPAQSPESAG
ncbi:MAG: DUF1194 domain-containing protein [Paracoccaceae bacterium]